MDDFKFYDKVEQKKKVVSPLDEEYGIPEPLKSGKAKEDDSAVVMRGGGKKKGKF